jgi:hypothetical protein
VGIPGSGNILVVGFFWVKFVAMLKLMFPEYRSIGYPDSIQPDPPSMCEH